MPIDYYKFLAEPVLDELEVQVIENSLLDGSLLQSVLVQNGVKYKLIPQGKALFELEEGENSSGNGSLISAQNFNLNGKFQLNDIDTNISNIKGGTLYYADCDGIFYVHKGIAKLYPITNDGGFRIHIDDKKMSVFLDFFPHFENGKKILFKEIYASLRQKKIEVDIHAKLIEEKIQEVEQSRLPLYGIEIAKGTPQLDGIDGDVEFLVDTEVDFKPRVSEDGRIDFHNLNSINTVAKDQKLAVYFPPVKEEHGQNVFGKKIIAKQAKVVPFPAGKNTYTDPSNPNLIRAGIEGNLIEKDGVISVSPVFVVKDNVDYSTGNIDNKGSVLILGDVKSGFRVDATETIEVNGLVEDAVLNAGSHVVIASGFTGSGSGLIKADGNVDVRYVRNQKIFSRNTINVTHEVMDSMIFAKHRIQVAGGRHMSILGGHALAGSTLEVNCLGNEYGVPTIVEVGFDYNLSNRVKQNKHEIEQFERTLENLEKNLKQNYMWMHLPQDQKKALQILVDQKILLYVSDSTDENGKTLKRVVSGIDTIVKHANIKENQKHDFKTIIDQKIAIKRTIRRKKEEIIELEKIIFTPSKAKIRTNRIVYPGVTILINKRKLVVDQQIMNKTFYLSKNGNEVLLA